MKIAESSLNQVENTVGKGEIACYEQFFLFPQCFQKACFPGPSKGVIVWEWVNPGKPVIHLFCGSNVSLHKRQKGLKLRDSTNLKNPLSY